MLPGYQAQQGQMMQPQQGQVGIQQMGGQPQQVAGAGNTTGIIKERRRSSGDNFAAGKLLLSYFVDANHLGPNTIMHVPSISIYSNHILSVLYRIQDLGIFPGSSLEGCQMTGQDPSFLMATLDGKFFNCRHSTFVFSAP